MLVLAHCSIARLSGLAVMVQQSCAAPCMLLVGKALLVDLPSCLKSEVRCCRHGEVSVSKLATGDYEVVDVRCRGCRAALGWRYLAAMQEVGGWLFQGLFRGLSAAAALNSCRDGSVTRNRGAGCCLSN